MNKLALYQREFKMKKVVLQSFKINSNWNYQESELKKRAFYALKKKPKKT